MLTREEYREMNEASWLDGKVLAAADSPCPEARHLFAIAQELFDRNHIPPGRRPQLYINEKPNPNKTGVGNFDKRCIVIQKELLENYDPDSAARFRIEDLIGHELRHVYVNGHKEVSQNQTQRVASLGAAVGGVLGGIIGLFTPIKAKWLPAVVGAVGGGVLGHFFEKMFHYRMEEYRADLHGLSALTAGREREAQIHAVERESQAHQVWRDAKNDRFSWTSRLFSWTSGHPQASYRNDVSAELAQRLRTGEAAEEVISELWKKTEDMDANPVKGLFSGRLVEERSKKSAFMPQK